MCSHRQLKKRRASDVRRTTDTHFTQGCAVLYNVGKSLALYLSGSWVSFVTTCQVCPLGSQFSDLEEVLRSSLFLEATEDILEAPRDPLEPLKNLLRALRALPKAFKEPWENCKFLEGPEGDSRILKESLKISSLKDPMTKVVLDARHTTWTDSTATNVITRLALEVPSPNQGQFLSVPNEMT